MRVNEQRSTGNRGFSANLVELSTGSSMLLQLVYALNVSQKRFWSGWQAMSSVLLVLSCFLHNPAYSRSVFINVYLKMPPGNNLSLLVDDFNRYLETQKVMNRFPITPYAKHYPLHNTLYLTHYPEKEIKNIINTVGKLAQIAPIPIHSKEFIVNEKGYIMLTLSPNERLQQLSDRITYQLMNWRDTKATIPIWAATDKKKVALFSRYGSPSVFQEFNPHCSILDASNLTPWQQKELALMVRPIIKEFMRTHLSKNTMGVALGVGLANEQGQIIKELAHFALSS